MEEYVEIEISIYPRRDEGFSVELRCTRPDSDSDIRVLSPQNLSTRIDTETLLQLSNDRQYGKELAGMLLAVRTVDKAFAEARAVAKERHLPLRIRLFIGPGAEALHGLKWESLRDPDQDSLLCAGEQVMFSRYLASLDWDPVRPQPHGQLKSLVVIANPRQPGFNLAAIQVDEELAQARAGLAQLGPVETLAADGSATFERIVSSLREGCHILYLVAHGHLDGNTPYLFLETASGGLDRVPAEQLTDQISGLSEKPLLAVLISCQSAAPGTSRALVALGPLLARAGIPAVIAMQGNLTMETAGLLVPSLFQSLKETNGQIDAALARARLAILKREDWWMPVLYMRSRTGQLWREAATDERKLDGRQVSTALQTLGDIVATHAPGLQARFLQQQTLLSTALEASKSALDDPTVWQALDELGRICAAIYGDTVGFSEVALGKVPMLPADPKPPFLGLSAYSFADARYFCGRDDLITRIVERLRRPGFLAVSGVSGSGKSSLVLAGVAPRLKAAEPELRVVDIRPGRDPLHIWTQKVAPQRPEEPLLLVVDQFEELFTICKTPEERERFIEQMLDLAERQLVVITLRIDFLADCAYHPALREVVQQNLELIAPMSADELREAMEEQAARGGLALEPGLGLAVLKDLAGQPGTMPLLQYALLELWHRRHGRWLRIEEYEALGGVQGVITGKAEEVYTSLDDREQELLQRILIRLTRLDSATGRDTDLRDTRRRVLISELAFEDTSPETTRELLDRLASARLVVKTESEVEVAHEAIIRHWPRLRGWLNENREELIFFQTVRDAAEQWERGKHDLALIVHRGPRAERAVALLSKGQLGASERERSYVRACQEIQQRERLNELELTLLRRRTSQSIPATMASWKTILIHVQGSRRPGGPYPVLLDLPGEQTFKAERAGGFQDVARWDPDRYVYGRYLRAQLLYDQRLLEAFRTKSKEFTAAGHRTRVYLRIDPPELRAAPWEKMFWAWRNTEPDFTEGMVLLRYIAPPSIRYPIVARQGQLRALAVIGPSIKGEGFGKGEGYRGRIFEEVSESIEQTLAGLPKTTHCSLRSGTPAAPTLERLTETLALGWDIVHIYSHIVDDDGAAPVLVLDDGQGGAQLVPCEQIVALFRALEHPPLLCVLMGVHTRVLGELLLAEAGIPVVVGTTRGDFPPPTALCFIEPFYRELNHHGNVEAAFLSSRSIAMSRAGADSWDGLALMSWLADTTIFPTAPLADPSISIRVVATESDRYHVALYIPDSYLFGYREIPTLGDLIRPKEDQQPSEPEQRRLSQIIFAGHQLELTLDKLIQEQANTQRTLGLQLLLSRSLEDLPWETLGLPSETDPTPFACNLHTPFARRVKVTGSTRPDAPLFKPPVRILVVLANPEQGIQRYHLPPFEPADIALCQELWADLPADRVAVTSLGTSHLSDASYKALEARILQGFDIVHFQIRGRRVVEEQASDLESRVTGLLFDADRDHSSTPQDHERVPSTALLAMLRASPNPPRLWVLPSGDMVSLSRQLVEAGGATAAIGGHRPASAESAREFTRLFYHQLVTHGRIDLAANQARAAISNPGDRSQFVLWSAIDNLRLIDMTLFDEFARVEPQATE